MRLDDRLVQADQHGAADLAVIHGLADLICALLAEEIPDLGKEIPLEHILHHVRHVACSALDALEQHVAGEAVGHDHVRAGQNVASLDVAGEVNEPVFIGLFQENIGVLVQLVALFFLRTVVQQRHAGPLDPERLLRVERAHAAELHQKFRRALRVRARVDQDRAGRKQRCKGRTADASDALDQQRARRQKRARVARGNHRVARAVGQHFQADDHGGIAVLLHDLGGVNVHIDHIFSIGDLDALRKIVQTVGLHAAQNILPAAHQHDLRSVFLCRAQRTQNDLVRRVVAAHCVNDNPHACSSFVFPVSASMCASARFAMARFLFALPRIRCSSGAIIPKLMFIGWKFPIEPSLM